MNILTILEYLINLFRTNKDIPKPVMHSEIVNNRLEIKGDLIIIHYPTFTGTKAIVDALNYLKIREAFEKQIVKRKPPPPERPPGRKIIPTK